MDQPTLTPPSLSTPLGAIAKKAFAARSAIEFTRLMEEFADQVRFDAADHLDRIAAQTEAQVAEHYGQASGIGQGSADVVRESAKTVRALAAVQGA